MKVRIKFWYKGTLHTKRHEGTFDTEIEDNVFEEPEYYIENQMEEALAKAITHGMVDADCNAGVADFKVINYRTKFTGEASHKE